MNDVHPQAIDYLDAVTRAAQYLASMEPGAECWKELGLLLQRFFQADLVGIAGRDANDRWFLRYASVDTAAARDRLLAALVGPGLPVLESGFLSTELLAIPEPYSCALLSLARNRRNDTLLVVGHAGVVELPRQLLDVYLAVARLMESTLTRLRYEAQLRLRAREQACIAALGHKALVGDRISVLLNDAVHRVATTMKVDYCGVFELAPDGEVFRLRAGFGWNRGSVGHATVDAHSATLPGQVLRSALGATEENALTERRYAEVKLLTDHHVISSAAVALSGREGAHGVLTVHTRAPREFTEEEINFMQSAANVLAAAWERHRTDRAIRKLNQELEARVAQRTRALEEALQELQDLNYSVSHDLRTPLRAIDGFAGLLLKEHGAQLDDEARRLLNVVRDNAQNMGRLIDDILAFSQVGRVDLRLADVDMTALAQRAWQARHAEAAQRQVEFHLEPLPPATGDRNLLREVFARLLDNALKFTRNVHPAVIEVRGRKEGGENIYLVHDNGIGFDMRFAAKLFGVFQRLHPEHGFEGTGIGLAVVKRIVKRHGGRVWAEGRPGGGATFYFALPAKEARHG
ncbi:MAG: ATP-binding protein [Thiohalomonadaceae bacterium]